MTNNLFTVADLDLKFDFSKLTQEDIEQAVMNWPESKFQAIQQRTQTAMAAAQQRAEYVQFLLFAIDIGRAIVGLPPVPRTTTT